MVESQPKTLTPMLKYTLLSKAGDQFNHPKSGKPIKLYRVISEMDFQTIDGVWVKVGEVGGYVSQEVVDNKGFSQTDRSWIFNTAKVFDNAMLVDSTIRGNAKIFGSAILTESVVCDHAHVYGNALVTRTRMGGKSDVFGDSVELEDCDLTNAAMVCHNAKVKFTKLKDGARISGSARVNNCVLTDTAEVRGTANIVNCHVGGRAVLNYGEYDNSTIHMDLELTIQSNEASEN